MTSIVGLLEYAASHRKNYAMEKSFVAVYGPWCVGVMDFVQVDMSVYEVTKELQSGLADNRSFVLLGDKMFRLDHIMKCFPCHDDSQVAKRVE